MGRANRQSQDSRNQWYEKCLQDREMQLQDTEQQLRDTKQRLQDTEQQLKDREKQLQAREKQLLETNHELQQYILLKWYGVALSGPTSMEYAGCATTRTGSFDQSGPTHISTTEWCNFPAPTEYTFSDDHRPLHSEPQNVWWLSPFDATSYPPPKEKVSLALRRWLAKLTVFARFPATNSMIGASRAASAGTPLQIPLLHGHHYRHTSRQSRHSDRHISLCSPSKLNSLGRRRPRW